MAGAECTTTRGRLHARARPRFWAVSLLIAAFAALVVASYSAGFVGGGARAHGSRLLSRAENPGGPPLPSRPLGVARPGPPGALRIELFLDVCCPFSRKVFETITTSVAPKYEGRVSFVIHSVVQPWHAQSSYMHEASLAVLEVAGPGKFWDYAGALFSSQERFFDDAVYNKSRKQIYDELAAVASSVGVDAAAVLDRLQLSGPGNAGNAVTQRLKWATKLHRISGVHVTPTVFLNGLEAGIVSSGWSPEQWRNFLDFHLESASST